MTKGDMFMSNDILGMKDEIKKIKSQIESLDFSLARNEDAIDNAYTYNNMEKVEEYREYDEQLTKQRERLTDSLDVMEVSVESREKLEKLYMRRDKLSMAIASYRMMDDCSQNLKECKDDMAIVQQEIYFLEKVVSVVDKVRENIKKR